VPSGINLFVLLELNTLLVVFLVIGGGSKVEPRGLNPLLWASSLAGLGLLGGILLSGAASINLTSLVYPTFGLADRFGIHRTLPLLLLVLGVTVKLGIQPLG
jgi:formate hydrogenlyase subunit 3/multisubunit Na+/H+ antiporter MnhD subunit